MPIIKLTDSAWLDREVERARGLLLVHLGKDGRPIDELLTLLSDYGLDYSVSDLLLIRNKLVADGVIEIV